MSARMISWPHIRTIYVVHFRTAILTVDMVHFRTSAGVRHLRDYVRLARLWIWLTRTNIRMTVIGIFKTECPGVHHRQNSPLPPDIIPVLRIAITKIHESVWICTMKNDITVVDMVSTHLIADVEKILDEVIFIPSGNSYMKEASEILPHP